ncbi:Crp/Fnr family transcriptional regulator [Salinispirillum sp. LH 10-3-1]|uniref:Crp/Fnr family transcriptional regulator n=1 Tax=Salinispirillum sp. LH 10-3-1 TaxID=2952525 RepID=A0AB38YCK9_9GAMM
MSSTNRLLQLLPEEESTGVMSQCDEITLTYYETLAEPGETYSHVYFPLSGIISLVNVLNGKPAIEAGLLGTEGMLGATVALGVSRAPTRALVQGSGAALRIDAVVFRDLLALHPTLNQVTMHYLYVVNEQLTQASVCTRFHVLESRLARWLLMTQDRAQNDTFDITHQYLASMLGVRREGITGAASKMQLRGLIHYRRGRLQIIDRQGLKKIACGCYGTNKASYERILGSSQTGEMAASGVA